MPPPGRLLAIRFALHGCTNRPFYHLVVMKRSAGRDAKPVEQLGTYDAMPNMHGHKMVAINFDRLKHWMALGAEPTQPVLKILGLCGFLPIHPMTYISAKRIQKKQAAEQLEKQQQEELSQQEAVS